MNTHTLQPKINRGLPDLRASIFPSESSINTSSESEFLGSVTNYSNPERRIIENVSLANMEAVLKLGRPFDQSRVSQLSTSYRFNTSRTHRVTTHRLGAAFADFMQRFHATD